MSGKETRPDFSAYRSGNTRGRPGWANTLVIAVIFAGVGVVVALLTHSIHGVGVGLVIIGVIAAAVGLIQWLLSRRA